MKKIKSSSSPVRFIQIIFQIMHSNKLIPIGGRIQGTSSTFSEFLNFPPPLYDVVSELPLLQKFQKLSENLQKLRKLQKKTRTFRKN